MAIDLLHSERYHKEEMIVMKPINEFYQNLEQRTKSQVNHLTADINRTSYYEFFTFTALITAVGLLLMVIRIQSKSIVKRFSASNTELKNALDDVKPLKGVIPVCSYCRNIRDDAGAWDRLEAYRSRHTDAQFSHGICPQCAKNARLVAELDSQ